MKQAIKTLLLITAGAVMIVSCDKKTTETNNNNNNADKKGEAGFEFHNYAGAEELKLDSVTYQTGAGESIAISKFNYYISNVKLKTADGKVFAEEESYHLVMADKASSGHFHLEGVPVGTYTTLSFLVGVDSARNTSGAQTGALDAQNGMFWSWNTGYIMAKLEGVSPQSTSPGNKVQYHIGGFKGENKGIREVTLALANPLVIENGKEGTIEIKADALKWFTPNEIKMAESSEIMSPSSTSKKIADNYANMFSIMQ